MNNFGYESYFSYIKFVFFKTKKRRTRQIPKNKNPHERVLFRPSLVNTEIDNREATKDIEFRNIGNILSPGGHKEPTI